MRPGSVRTVLRVILPVTGLSLLILIIFAGTAFALAAAASLLHGSSLTSPQVAGLGLICGLIFWLFVAVFHIKRETILVPTQGNETFLREVKTYFEQLGYECLTQTQKHLVLKPAFHSLLFGGEIDVLLEGALAQIKGPKVYVERLRYQYRWQQHLAKARKVIQDCQRRQGEKLLRRVQISLRIPRELWDRFDHEVIETLTREDAKVYCDINVLAQSDQGIRESTVEQLIRDWCRRQELKTVILKEPLQLNESETPRDQRCHPELEPAR